MGTKSRDTKSLTDQQELFCQEYLKDLNATEAAKRAKYAKKTSHVQGPRLLGNVRVKARIQELMDKRSERTKITSDLVLQEILKIATVDLSLAFDDNGDLLPIKEIPKEIRMAVAGVEILGGYRNKEGDLVGYTKKVKLWNKVRALELLGQHLVLFKGQQDPNKETLADIIVQSMKEEGPE